jgi:hypothetical protein
MEYLHAPMIDRSSEPVHSFETLSSPPPRYENKWQTLCPNTAAEEVKGKTQLEERAIE